MTETPSRYGYRMVKRGGLVKVCIRCGLVAGDTDQHDAWHREHASRHNEEVVRADERRAALQEFLEGSGTRHSGLEGEIRRDQGERIAEEIGAWCLGEHNVRGLINTPEGQVLGAIVCISCTEAQRIALGGNA